MNKLQQNQRRCGLCNVCAPDWEKHVASDLHKKNLEDMGGISNILDRRKRTAGMNPVLAEKLHNKVDLKMKRLMTGTKSYDIFIKNDDFKEKSGYITPEGDWLSCDSTDHDDFAYDYVKELYPDKIYEITNSKKTFKDYLVDELGWVSVTVALLDNYVVGSKSIGINHKQKKMLLKWFLKFKLPFHVDGDKVTDRFDDFFTEV